MRSKVAYTAYLFYKWDASVDPEYAPDAHGEAVNPPQIVAMTWRKCSASGLIGGRSSPGFSPRRDS